MKRDRSVGSDHFDVFDVPWRAAATSIDRGPAQHHMTSGRQALLTVEDIDTRPDAYLAEIGDVFACFGEPTQDSGNRAFGVLIGTERFFVKTAGVRNDDYPRRVAVLRNAVNVARSFGDVSLPTLRNVFESPDGPALVYDWVDGELLHVPRERRDRRQTSFYRFRRLRRRRILSVLDTVYGVHRALAAKGWVAADFYDGSLIYDFRLHVIHIVDLDSYRRGPQPNEMGRMFGSTRFMAPEEFERGATIDERTTVFTLGRTAAVLLSDGSLDRRPFRGSDDQHAVIKQACSEVRRDRHATVSEFVDSWEAVRAEER